MCAPSPIIALHLESELLLPINCMQERSSEVMSRPKMPWGKDFPGNESGTTTPLPGRRGVWREKGTANIPD